MIPLPQGASSCDVRGLAAIYLPPMCPLPALRAWLSVVVENRFDALVTVVPATEAPKVEITSAVDRLMLAIDPKLVSARGPILSGEAQVCCDPFLFRIADTMRCGFRVHVVPPAKYLESLVAPVATHLRKHYTQASRSGLSPRRLQLALDYIDANLADPPSLAAVAAAAHMSPFHFSRMFRRSTGLPPHDYITNSRMKRARELLSGTDLLLADIAERIGYRTQAHFTQAFHERVGTTPARFRDGAG